MIIITFFRFILLSNSLLLRQIVKQIPSPRQNITTLSLNKLFISFQNSAFFYHTKLLITQSLILVRTGSVNQWKVFGGHSSSHFRTEKLACWCFDPTKNIHISKNTHTHILKNKKGQFDFWFKFGSQLVFFGKTVNFMREALAVTTRLIETFYFGQPYIYTFSNIHLFHIQRISCFMKGLVLAILRLYWLENLFGKRSICFKLIWPRLGKGIAGALQRHFIISQILIMSHCLVG